MRSILQQRNWRLSKGSVAYSTEFNILESSTVLRRISFSAVIVPCARDVPETLEGYYMYLCGEMLDSIGCHPKEKGICSFRLLTPVEPV